MKPSLSLRANKSIEDVNMVELSDKSQAKENGFLNK